MKTIAILPNPATAVIRFAPARTATAARTRAAGPHRFADAMETAMTGLVFTGALLFAAGLLHIAAPTILGETILRALACVTGAITLAGVVRGFSR